MAMPDSDAPVNPYAPPEAGPDGNEVRAYKTSGIDLSVENPFVTIWLRPRATIRGILDRNPSYLVTSLAMAGGVLQALDRATQRNAGNTLSLATILILALALGPIGGLIGVYLGGAVLGWVGRSLGGRGESEEVRAALAWSQVPALAAIPIWILQIALVGHEMFTSNTPNLDASPGLGMLLLATGLIEILVGVWAFITMLRTVGEAHRFSAWKSLGSLLLIALVVGIPILLLVLLSISMRLS
jgi:hypothetical protein